MTVVYMKDLLVLIMYFLFADIYGISRQDVHDVFDKVDLADDKWEKAGNLSKGMRQRLVIARAILHQAGTFIFGRTNKRS